MDRARQKLEVDQNYDVFMRQLASLIPDHRDQYALMRDGEIVGFFDQPRDALIVATERFPDGIFSLQEVTDEPIDLGFWSHVVALNGRASHAEYYSRSCSLLPSLRPI